MNSYPIPAGAIDVIISDPMFSTPAPPVNLPPTANAGTDVSITLPANSVSLAGRGVDPEGKAVSFAWTELTASGARILSPQAANTDVIGFSSPGIFTFRITVTDDQGQIKTDDVNVTVSPAVVVPPPSAYEGFGRDAVSATASLSLIKEVRSKADFEAAIGSNRIVRFMAPLKFIGRYDLSGLINLWIDGNGFDITIDNNNGGDGVSIGGAAHHVFVKGIRVINAGNDGINVVDSAHDVMIDHCSSYDNRDGNIDIAATAGQNVTVQYCFLGRGSAGWSGDMLVTCKNVSAHHNLFSPVGTGVAERCPFAHCNYSPVGSPNVDFRNNLVNIWDHYGSGIDYKATANFVNNYYIGSGKAITLDADPTAGSGAKAFISGNFGKGITFPASNNSEYVISDPYKVTIQDALAAAKLVKAGAGMIVKTSYEQQVLDSINL